MIRSSFSKWIVLCCLAAAVAFAGCASDSTTSESTGSLGLSLELAPGVTINEVAWEITGGDMEPMSGTIDTSAPGATASVEVFGLPPGDGYTVTLSATDETGEVSCGGDADFSVEAGVATDVMVFLNCKLPSQLGGVRVNGKFNICAELSKVVVSPLQTSVGNDISLSAEGIDAEGDDIEYLWTASGGAIADPGAQETTYTCTDTGEQTLLIAVSDDGFEDCMSEWSVAVTCVDGDGGTGGTGGSGTGGAGGAAGEGGAGGAAGEGGAGGAAGEGGAGGAAGEGGAGGAPTGSATVTAAHFAPEVPTAADTSVAIYVNGVEVTALGTIEYGQTTGRVELPAPATYDIGVGLAGGDGPIVELTGVELNDGDDIAAAAYRTGVAEAPVDLFPYDLSTDGLEAGSGRLYVSHGADDSLLDPVDLIVTDEGACPPPFLDQLNFAETRQGDLPAATYNLGFDLDPGDCDPELLFGAPITEAVTTVAVAVDEAVGEGLDVQVWALVDADTVVALNPEPPTGECSVDGDCDDGNECTVNTCDAGSVCSSSNVDDGTSCQNGEGMCMEGVCEPPPPVACEYQQNFEGLDPANANALSDNGWLYFGNVFDGTVTPPVFKFGFGPFAAPTTSGQISAIASGEGGAEQGTNQLVVFSNYDCCGPGTTNEGHFNGTDLVETIVFQEPFPNSTGGIPGSEIGKTYTFQFDAKAGNIGGNTTAQAFIRTLDPNAGFNTTNNVVLDTTSLPASWGTYSIEIDLSDPALEGQILQVGYSTIASNFDPAGNFYDNITFGIPGCSVQP